MAEDSSLRCSYVFDPAVWEQETGRSSQLDDDELGDDGHWHCDREAQGDSDLCLFHLPPSEKDATTVRDGFLERITERGAAAKQFVGARFGPFDLHREVVACADNHEIDLRHAQFEAKQNWQYAIVRQPITFAGATFAARPDFLETTFERSVAFDAARFDATAQFVETTFAASFMAYKTRFSVADFHRAQFEDRADFSESRFEKANFREGTFGGITRFDLTVFEHGSFTGASFENYVYFDGATLPETFKIKQAEIDELLSLEDVTLADGCCWVDMAGASIAAGRLYLPEDGTLAYDLTNATMGAVSLTDGEPRDSLLDHYRFQNTTFEGFDFGAYRSVLHEAGWRLHEVCHVGSLEEQPQPLSTGEKETTYLKAKNGANEIGETKAAAEFFRHEMLNRRKQYLPDAPGKWIANALLDVTAGYGERPSRVVGVSVGTILAFGGVFALLRSEPLYDTPVGYLVLSLQSFITLVLGGAEDVGGPWIRLLAQIEGFVGAFLIALFVFTLTRSIHR